MVANKDKAIENNGNISLFMEYMKKRDEKSLEIAKKSLKNIKSYSSTKKNGTGYRIRIKCKDEEKTFDYSFSLAYGKFMKWVTENANLCNGKIGYIENTEGYIFNYMAQRRYDSVGYTINYEQWEKSIFSNFPVYRRESLRGELPLLYNGVEKVHKVDKLIWIVNDYNKELEIINKLFIKSTTEVLMMVSVEANIDLEDISGRIVLDEIQELVNGSYRFIYISDSSVNNKKTTRIPEGLQVLKTNYIIFSVEMNKCRDNNGFMYTEEGHYFVETLRQYQENKELVYEDSYLKKYYDGFQPQNRRDNYLWEEDVECFPMDHGWLYDPWRKPANPPLREKRFETRKGGNHNVGPNTEAFGKAEFKRLINVYKALKTNGYNPDFFVDGYITGYILVRKDDYRFVVSEGQHRIAALAALDYEDFVCRFDLKPWTNETVFYNRAHKWPQVKANIFTPRVAKMCFEHFFKTDNNMRLNKLINK